MNKIPDNKRFKTARLSPNPPYMTDTFYAIFSTSLISDKSKLIDMIRELPLRIILESPPSGVDFGIQKGSGNQYETILLQKSRTSDLRFEFKILLKETKTSLYNFAGPIVQGPSNERFIYIDIGTAAGQTNSEWTRRLKIPLRDISTEIIEQILNDSSLVLETKVSGTSKDGSPNCATVKPFLGWKLGSI